MSDVEVLDSTRRRETRRRLVEAAETEFGRRGIDATSVEQLCEVAGFTRGAFYSNFQSKDELALEMAKSIVERNVSSYRELLTTAPEDSSPQQVITRMLGVYGKTLNEQRIQLELHLRATRDPEFSASFARLRAESQVLATEVLELAATRLQVKLLMDPNRLIRLMEALFFAPQLILDDSRTEIITNLLELLTKPENQ